MNTIKWIGNKLEVDGRDSNASAFLKGAIEGILVSCTVLGAVVYVSSVNHNIKFIKKGRGE